MANTERIPAPALSRSVGDYLKTIWSLNREGPASTKDLAARLEVAPPSVSGMLKRLQEMDLVDHTPYHGARLTPAGDREALRLVRRHRLIETFLVEHLGYSWEEVHEEAEVLEHAVSDRFVVRLDELLGHPSHDPHGDPIPGERGSIPETPDTPLSEVEDGVSFEVHRIDTQDPEELAHLAALGLTPGRRVRVAGSEPGAGGILVRFGGREGTSPHIVSRSLARCVFGEVRRDG